MTEGHVSGRPFSFQPVSTERAGYKDFQWECKVESPEIEGLYAA